MLAQFQFGSVSNQTSAFLMLPLSNVGARQPDGTVVGTTFTRNGRVVMIGEQPLLEMTRSANDTANLRLFSRPGVAHDLQQAPQPTGAWTVLERLRFPGREKQVPLGVDAGGMAFFRLASVDVSTPFLEILSSDGSGMDVAFYATRGLTFDLQTRGDLTLPWNTWRTQAMTNSFHEFRLNFSSGTNQFLRAKKL